MFYVDGGVLFRAFNEVNKVLFFNQLKIEDVVMMIDGSLDSEFSYCYRETDNVIYLGVMEKFEKESYFMYCFVHEMIRLFQYQIRNEEPNYGPSFKTFHHSALNKFRGRMVDPHEDD